MHVTLLDVVELATYTIRTFLVARASSRVLTAAFRYLYDAECVSIRYSTHTHILNNSPGIYLKPSADTLPELCQSCRLYHLYYLQLHNSINKLASLLFALNISVNEKNIY